MTKSIEPRDRPISTLEASSDRFEGSESAPGSLGSRTILVIDDDPRIAKVLQRLFSTEGYGSRCAFNGKGGLEMFAADYPDVVILDLMLPDMRGQEICQVMKNLSPQTPVIILTAVSDVAARASLLKLGADDYLTKPFSPKELLARVQAAMRR